ncbi:DUF5004 domain-containing protein [Gelidibacter salicanalis]|uniref:DUF5004 domain-containing protein n=1 Tax=Gelidibacter salicanalis TaxID=291193 RepID=A0A934NKD6_9FLAO|nr:DUF5004 domain-containing protein [Gelidibacter salicanalis]MBJ7880037.1 DUF5004 domain-containing protein [Gelidibacter salicanalis]
MKKLNVLTKSLMVMTTLFLVSCNTDDGIECPVALTGELTATETAFSGSWEFSGLVAEDALDITADNTENPIKDLYAQYPECDRDLVYEFMDTRAYVYKQGYFAEDCQNKQSITGTWSLTGTVLTFVSSCASQKIDIELKEEGNSFSYDATVNVREVSGNVKTTKVTFTFEKTDSAEQV